MAADPYEQVRRVCTGLPEVVEVDAAAEVHGAYVGVRFKIRNRIVAEVFEWEGSAPMLVVFVDPDERVFLLHAGHPYFSLRHTDKRIGLVFDKGTDWDEVAELVTESYRLTAPKKLVALLDEGT